MTMTDHATKAAEELYAALDAPPCHWAVLCRADGVLLDFADVRRHIIAAHIQRAIDAATAEVDCPCEDCSKPLPNDVDDDGTPLPNPLCWRCYRARVSALTAKLAVAKAALEAFSHVDETPPKYATIQNYRRAAATLKQLEEPT